MLRHRLLDAKYTLAGSYFRATNASRAWRHWHQSCQPHIPQTGISSQTQSNIKQLILQFSLPKQGFASLQQSPGGDAAHPITKSRFNTRHQETASQQLLAKPNASISPDLLESAAWSPATVQGDSLLQFTVTSCFLTSAFSMKCS